MKTKLKCLIACEFSGILREAFSARGWDSWSVDLLDSEIPGQHIKGDAKKAVVSDRWDLIIAHPPCTYLANSGVRWLYKNGEVEPKRWEEVKKGAKFFSFFIGHWSRFSAVENPIMHKHAKNLIFGSENSAPQSIVQPWWFGHTQVKATCFWTRNLPKLVPSNNVKEETMALSYGERAKVHYASPGPDRWKERSRILTGLATALATQWGAYIENQPQPVRRRV